MQGDLSHQELLDELAIARSAAVIQKSIEEAAEGKDTDAVEALKNCASRMASHVSPALV